MNPRCASQPLHVHCAARGTINAPIPSASRKPSQRRERSIVEQDEHSALQPGVRFHQVLCHGVQCNGSGFIDRIAVELIFRQLRQVLEHIAAHRESVWLTTPGEIARHVIELPAGTVPGDARAR